MLLCIGLTSGCRETLKELIQPSEEAVVVSQLAKELGFSKEQPLVMGMNTSYAPLQYVDDKGTPSGYDVQFTKILMKRMGIPYTFSPNHWDKMSPGIIEGKYDMGLLVYSPYRKELTNYSNAVFRMYYQIVYRKQDYKNFDFRHLKGKTIAYMKSRPIGLMLKDAEAKDVAITDLSEAIKQLADGKYDGVICYRFQAQYNMGILHLENKLQAEELSLEPREYCYASHDPRLINAINDELKRMDEEGIIDEIYGDNVLTQFGVIKIPMWIWVLLMLLTIMFLVIYSINRHRYSRKLKHANEQLQKAYSQLEENNEQLKTANARAEESTRMKSNFIKQISPEIRTPLNILSGFTQLITSTGINLSDKDRKEARQQIIVSTNRITSLVNKMLELSEISSQAVLERNDKVTALQIARQAVNNSGILASMGLLSALISSMSLFSILIMALDTFSLLQSHLNAVFTLSFILSPMSPKSMFRISSGVFPFFNISVMGSMVLIFSSSLAMISSGAKGSSWTISPPAQSTFPPSGAISTPSATAEGVCSDVAK